MKNEELGLSITSIDVAKKAGVSQATVSRAFDKKSKMKDETRKKVIKAAKELGYKPNAIARSLTSSKTNMVGIVVDSNNNLFYPKVLNEFAIRLQKLGKQALYFVVEKDQDVDEILDRILEYRVEGLIITCVTLYSEMVKECIQRGISVVLFNRYVNHTSVKGISCDNVEAGRTVANYLLDKGYRKLAYISGKENSSTNKDRLKGFKDRLNERGISHLVVQKGGYSYEEGAEAARSLFRKKQSVEAIFCASDMIALGVMDVARFEWGMKIPEDLAVVGFDDNELCSMPTYHLTSVRQPIEAMVTRVIECIFGESNEHPALELFPCELIERKSVK